MIATPPLITCFEYEVVDLECDDRLLRSLELLHGQIGKEIFQVKLQSHKLRLKAQQFVGVFQLGDRTIQVLPKLYKSTNAKNDRQVEESIANLMFLLRYGGDLPIPTDLVGLQKSQSDFWEILIRLFAENLRSQWQRGAFRTYQAVDDVLPMLKGQWRLTEQLRHPARQHRFAVTYDEFTADNQLNRVLRYVVERLWYLTRSGANRRVLGELRLWMEEVTLLPGVTLAETLALPMTRLNQRFEPLLNLARLFLGQESVQLSSGNSRTYGFTLDMNVLFEQFVANFLKRHQSELPADCRDCELEISQTPSKYLATATATGQNVFKLKPDLAFRTGKQYRLIIDTKYKCLKEGKQRLGVTEADMYQMYAYAQGFCCDRVILLYPQTAEISEPIRESYTLKESGVVIQVATVNLDRDSNVQQLIQEFVEILGAANEYAS